MPSRRNKKNGGGWGVGPASISPGYLVNQRYDGAGTDCAGTPMRSGYMDMYSKEGLPGFQGGSRRHKGGKHSRKRRSTQGGRYEVNPGAYLPSNAIGASAPSYAHSIPCESTRSMQGGMNPAPYESSGSSANFPAVQVGASDSMRYEAPNAGYTNDFTTFRAGAVPGFTIQTPYNAGSFNQACLKTGGNLSPTLPLQMSQVGNRSAFDGTNGGLPVKFGGSRRHKSRKQGGKGGKGGKRRHRHTRGCKHKRRITRK